MNIELREPLSTSATSPMDDQYRQKISKNATAILNSLFSSISADISKLKTLNILVIGAGMFPSFTSLILALQRRSPNLDQIIFTIIEPLKSETSRFHDFISRSDLSGFNFKVECSTHNLDIKEYLLNTKDKYFDIIYFEQPDLSPVGILLANTISDTAKLNLSLREAVPFLKKFVRPNTIIVATFLFKRDLKQLNTLIKYSLKIQTKTVYLSRFKPDGSPYNSGSISLIDPPKLPKEHPHQIASAIKKQDTYYVRFVLLSILLFIITPPSGKVFSLLCTVILLLNHRYGWGNIIIKLTIILMQLCILLLELYIT